MSGFGIIHPGAALLYWATCITIGLLIWAIRQ
jgi:hypothetical protein